jgi:hypothetical protein
MTRRFAGDVFNSPRPMDDSPDRSILVDYFPEFKDFTKRIGNTTKEEEFSSIGGVGVVAPFGGFKPLQKQETQAPRIFAGAKPSGYKAR